MSAFTEFVDYIETEPGHFVLLKPLEWELGRKGSGLVYVVPAGFVFDISVPRFLRWLVSHRDRGLTLAAALHDRMLADGWKRGRAAIEFYQATRAMSIPKPWAVIIAAAVMVWTSR